MEPSAKNMTIPRFYVGTSGWSYKHWHGVFYPEDVKQNKFLEYYTTQFPCVELNATFYRLPKPTMVDGWKTRTPGSFRFCPKMSRYITHRLKLTNTQEALKKFFDALEGIKNQMGPVLIQLPPNMQYDHDKAEKFLSTLTKSHGRFQYALEARHDSWFTDECMNMFQKYNIALVLADSGDRFPSLETETADHIFIRFHGQKELYSSNYSQEELKPYAQKIAHWLDNEKEVWVFFNNDTEGYAPNNAKTLYSQVEEILTVNSS